MSELPSRRDVLLGGIAASLTLPLTVNANTPAPEPDAITKTDDELLVRARKASTDNSAQRQKYVLKENSEPCFTYIPDPRQVRER